jgi:hypothetical protein
MRAHECKTLALTLTAVDEGDAPSIPDTATGTTRSVVELSPTLPKVFKPQHFTLPSAITTHVCISPALTLTANDDGDSPSIFDTSTGTLVDVVVPSPNWPEELSPQHRTLPFAITAHPRSLFMLMFTAIVEGESAKMPFTSTGTRLLVVELLPN